eukprot:jgi/Hompol1/6450/HPOL_004984-RA
MSSGKFFIVVPNKTLYCYAKARYVYESITEDKSLPVPVNISHVRSLHKYSPEVRRYIWRQLCESNTPITEETVVAMTIQYETGSSFKDINNELYTPRAIIAAAKEVAGISVFDTDPASCSIANDLHPGTIAKVIYTEKTDGVLHPWPGHVWLSPPAGYDTAGASRQKQWFLVAEQKYLDGESASCHALLRAELTSDWFSRVMCYPHCFFLTRLQFGTPTGREKSLNEPHVLAYLGPNIEKFCEQFGRLGTIPGYNSWSFFPSAKQHIPSPLLIRPVIPLSSLACSNGASSSSNDSTGDLGSGSPTLIQSAATGTSVTGNRCASLSPEDALRAIDHQMILAGRPMNARDMLIAELSGLHGIHE